MKKAENALAARTLASFLVLAALLSVPQATRAQDSSAAAQTSSADAAEPSTDAPVATLFSHSESSRFWISGQANIILQWHPSFPAKYSGPNSLTPQPQSSTTRVLTLYTAYRLSATTEVLADVEDSTGGGIGNAVGLAGLTDLDAVRTSQGIPLSRVPYLARLMLRQIIPLSGERVTAGRGPFGLATSLPARRLEFRIGKFSLVDFFDANSGGSDSHLQFLNWTVDNNGAWDYAANTRGYTDGVIVEYDDRRWSARFAEAMMPKVANGINLDANLFRAHSENVEGEVRGNLLRGRAGVLRLLGYVNHANMGNYREAINNFLSVPGQTRPDIVATRRQGRVKYGFGVNFDQELASQLGVFGRWGWSDGRNESFVYTEVDKTIELGAWLKGEKWRRRLDRAGTAFTANSLSPDHSQYLALGGLGFLLGDGALTYGREKIFEGFYTAHLWRGIFAAFDLQHINNPGYNRDRGPVIVPGVRLHVDF